MKSFLIIIFNSFIFCSLFGQADSVELELVTITASRSNLYSIGNQKQFIDSSFLAENKSYNLAELAAKHTDIFINTYGPGLLNSASARGSGSGHTAVLWNGFNIQNSMNGIVDFSLVPVGLFDNINIDYGGSGALFGSGSVGSTVHLNSKKKLQKGWYGNILLGGGSYGNFSQQGALQFGTKKITSSLAVIHTKADNDFEYTYNQTNGKQTNSAFNQLGIHQDNTIQLSDNQFIKSFIWYQTTDRQIAPSATEGSSDAFQEDRSFRGGLEWSLFKKDVNFKARGAYFDEYLLFASSLVDSSISYTKTFITEAETTFDFSANQSLNIGFHYTFDHANSNIFDSIKKRNRMALFAIWKAKYWKQKGNLVASLRQEVADEQFVPLTPSIGTEVFLFKGFQVNAKAAGMYKLPNFNDLYWPQVGDPELLPESGWNAEMGFIYKTTIQNWFLKGSATGFNSFIDNWILWSPNNGIWKPSNQRSVWSRGFSSDIKLERNTKNFGFETTIDYQFTKSTLRQPDDQSEIENIGKQLIYTPLHQANASISFRYKKTKLSYFHIFAGERFTTTDNSQTVDSYNVGDISLTQYFKIKNFLLEFNLRVNNIWDNSYTILPARPMPMRNYLLSLKMSF